MKLIPLTQGQFALIDDEDYEKISACRWFAHPDRCTKSYRAARFILLETRAEAKQAGRRQSVGSYATLIEAAMAYNQAAKQHYGEFARLNQILEREG